MDRYSLVLILVVISLCRGLESEYPCSSTICSKDQACYPVAVNCQKECSYKGQCMGRRALQSPCPFGNPLVRSNGTPYQCDFSSNDICPSKSSCYPIGTYPLAICCWNYSVAGNSVENGACPKPTGIGNCKAECQEDSDCRGLKKCCFNGCGRHCVGVEKPISSVPYFQPPGRCPTEKPPKFVCSFRVKCSTDDECINGYKCCHISGCGSVCRPPVKESDTRTQSVPVISKRKESYSIQSTSSNANCPWFKRIYGGCYID